MPEITLTLVPWPVDTTVQACPRRSELKMPDLPPPGVPVAGQAIVAAGNGAQDRSLTFDLEPGMYWAIAANPDAPPPTPPIHVDRPSEPGYASGVKVVTLGRPPQLLYLSFKAPAEPARAT